MAIWDVAICLKRIQIICTTDNKRSNDTEGIPNTLCKTYDAQRKLLLFYGVMAPTVYSLTLTEVAPDTH